jgi:adenylate cyclase
MVKQLISRIQDIVLKSNISGVAIGIASFLLISLFSFTTAYDLFELKLYDLRFLLKHAVNPVTQSTLLTFLDIDDHSINNIGEFPWPRSFYARGLEVLKTVGARQATFDTQFPDDSPRIVNREAFQKIQQKVARQRLSAEDIRSLVFNNDAVLAGAIGLHENVVLPFSFPKEVITEKISDPARKRDIAKARKFFIQKASVEIPKNRQNEFSDLVDPERKSILTPIPEFIYSAKAFGFVDSDFDIDGIARKIRLLRVYDGRLYYHMALVMLIDMCGVKKEDVEVRPGDRIMLKNALDPGTMVRGNIAIPIDRQGRLYINWAGEFQKHFNHLPFFGLIEYTEIKDAIHEFIAADEKAGPATAELSRKLEGEYEAFYSEKDQAKKARLWSGIQELKDRLYAKRIELVTAVREEISKTEEKFKKNQDPGLQEYLANLKNYPLAIELVAKVEKLRDHSTIIGLTATGTQDLGVTPLSSQYLMVGTYHNVVNTILQRRFIVRTGWLFNYTLMLLIAVGMGMLIQRLNARRSLAAIGISFVAVNLILTAAFAFFHIWLDQLGISLALLVPSLTIGAIKFVSEETQKRFIKNAFSYYLSPKVIDNIIKDPDSFKLGGESRVITTFFSDIAKFSTISEKLAPTDLVALLNEYLSEMTDIVLRYEGTVDKYEGDAIMAFWGAPQSLKDHAARACFAAIDMQARLREMRVNWKQQGKDELFVRIGLNSGEAVVGNMGSRTRMDYTVMGDSVNLASRLEGANKYYGTSIMISENVLAEVRDEVVVRKLDRIRVVGKAEPIAVYELICRRGEIQPEINELLQAYQEGIDLFANRDWTRARNAFKTCLKMDENDGPSQKFIERCNDYLKTPPPKNWDGVYSLKAK